jgi:cysteine dioxygenase
MVDAISDAQQLLQDIDNPTPEGMRDLLVSLDFDADALEEIAGPAGLFPYGRKVICSTPEIELLVMNWAPRQECAPHDHGRSFGWIQIVDGTARHRLYTLDQHDVPALYLQRTEHAGQLYFAPHGQVHQMGNPGLERLITLHLYAPPISGMHIYDLERCRVCVVSDDCGAWWPAEKRQLLRERSLTRVGDRRDQRRARPTL